MKCLNFNVFGLIVIQWESWELDFFKLQYSCYSYVEWIFIFSNKFFLLNINIPFTSTWLSFSGLFLSGEFPFESHDLLLSKWFNLQWSFIQILFWKEETHWYSSRLCLSDSFLLKVNLGFPNFLWIDNEHNMLSKVEAREKTFIVFLISKFRE